MEKKYLTPAQLAEILQVPISFIYARTRIKGPDSMPCLRVGKYCRLSLEDVISWLERQGRERD